MDQTCQDTTAMPTSDQERLVQFQQAVHNMTIGDALAQIKSYLPIRAGHAAKGVQQLRIYTIRGSKESDHFLDLQVDIGQSTMSMRTVICSDVGRIAVEDLLWPGGACHHTRPEIVSVKQQEGSRLPPKSEYISASASGNKFIYWGHGNNACAYDVEQLEKTRAGRALVALANPTKQHEIRHSKSMHYLTRQPLLPNWHVDSDAKAGQALRNIAGFAASEYNASRGYLGPTPELLKRQQSSLDDDSTTSLRTIRQAVSEKGGYHALSHIGDLVDHSVEIPYSPVLKINGIFRSPNYTGPGDLKVVLGKSIVPLGALVACSVGSQAIMELLWPNHKSTHQRSIAGMAISFVAHRWNWNLSGQHIFQIEVEEGGYSIRWGQHSPAQSYQLGDLTPTLAGRRAIQISSGSLRNRNRNNHSLHGHPTKGEGTGMFTPITTKVKRILHRGSRT